MQNNPPFCTWCQDIETEATVRNQDDYIHALLQCTNKTSTNIRDRHLVTKAVANRSEGKLIQVMRIHCPEWVDAHRSCHEKGRKDGGFDECVRLLLGATDYFFNSVDEDCITDDIWMSCGAIAKGVSSWLSELSAAHPIFSRRLRGGGWKDLQYPPRKPPMESAPVGRSGYHGVRRHGNRTWSANLQEDGMRRHLGTFHTGATAALARDAALENSSLPPWRKAAFRNFATLADQQLASDYERSHGHEDADDEDEEPEAPTPNRPNQGAAASPNADLQTEGHQNQQQSQQQNQQRIDARANYTQNSGAIYTQTDGQPRTDQQGKQKKQRSTSKTTWLKKRNSKNDKYG
jgi:hypothetical protein